jgi:hypothetical protein
VLGVLHPALVVGVVGDHLAQHFIPFEEVLAIQLRPSDLQFLEQAAGTTLLVREPMAAPIAPG